MTGCGVRVVRVLLAVLLLCGVMPAQQAENAPVDSPAKAPVLSAQARLLAAHRIYIEHLGASLPNDVIGNAFAGWFRYTLVGSPEKADLIVSINAPEMDGSLLEIRLSILDAHDRLLLWGGVERPKSALKERRREDNVIESSLKLFRRFRAVIEPEGTP